MSTASLSDAPLAPLPHPATVRPADARTAAILAHPASRLRLVGAAAGTGTDAAASPAPAATPGNHAVLQRALADLTGQGRSLCSLLGMTSEWGHARWGAGPTSAHLVGTFRVVVHGENPDHEMIGTIARRLARHGWTGAVLAETPVARLDCSRSGLVMRLTAHGGTITLSLQGQPVLVGRTLAASVLAGVFDDDDDIA